MAEEKLKTLKEMVRHQNHMGISESDLKAEAVKWLKEEISINLTNCSERKTPGNISWVIKDDDIQRWIKRFNLTEEDLK